MGSRRYSPDLQRGLLPAGVAGPGEPELTDAPVRPVAVADPGLHEAMPPDPAQRGRPQLQGPLVLPGPGEAQPPVVALPRPPRVEQAVEVLGEHDPVVGPREPGRLLVVHHRRSQWLRYIRCSSRSIASRS